MAASTESPPLSRETLRPDRIDDLGREASRKRTTIWIASLVALLLATLVAAVALGPVSLSPGLVGRIISHNLFGIGEANWSDANNSIVWQVRLPRVLLGAIVGGGLAVCGVALQAMVRNVLADPYLLGVSSGASTGAAAAILFGVGVAFGEHALAGSAFVGAASASLLVFVIARAAGKVTSVRLLLAGVAVGYALYAATSFLIFASPNPEGARSVMFWLLGSLSLGRWGSVFVLVTIIVLLTITILTIAGRQLDALAIGDETAQTLGTSPTRFRVQLLILVSLCVGAVVSISGGIGFVGLVIPHVARRFVGGAHRRLVPVAALIGAIFLVWADVFARMVIQPRELPIGILTALVGAPFLLMLVRRLNTAS